MRVFALALACFVLMAGCGGGGVLTPGGCVTKCESLREQLKRDFGVMNVNCGTSDILSATNASDCACAITRETHVRDTACMMP